MNTTELAEQLLIGWVRGRQDIRAWEPDDVVARCAALAQMLHEKTADLRDPVPVTRWLVPLGYKLVKDDSK